MKKHNLNISLIAILGVICAGLTTNAMAAGTVRSLGGAGTFNGTTAASTSTRTAAPTRAGSLRVSPSSTRLVATPTTATPGAATSGAAQRLSIGKYLGGATTTTATVSSGSSSGAGSASSNVGDLEHRIEALEANVGHKNDASTADTLSSRVSDLENSQLSVADTDTLLDVDSDGYVSINVTNLAAQLAENGTLDPAREIEFQYVEDDESADNHAVQWRYTSGDDQTWKTLFNTDDLVGEYVSVTQLNNAISNLVTQDDLADYVTNTSLSETLANYAASGDVPTVDNALNANSTNPVQNSVITSALGTKIEFGDVPQTGEYVLGFIDGVQVYIPVVDELGASGDTQYAFADEDDVP